MTTTTDAARRAERARDVALFRYTLVREAADPALSRTERGVVTRGLAQHEHPGPFGTRVRVSRASLDRWIRAWRRGGFDALLPSTRQVAPRTDVEVLDLAEALKRENPRRTATQIAQVIERHLGSAPSARTLQRHFARLELNTRPDGKPPRVFGRFEAPTPNQMWTADALHGPKISGRATYLHAIIDDHSRMIVGHRWSHHEDTARWEAVLRQAVTSRGIPRILYADNGAPFVSKHTLRTCAVLGIRVTHSRPGKPQGRGKVERLFRTIRAQFLAEIAPTTGSAGTTVTSIDELNTLFTAWVETVYHQRVHTETHQRPLDRWHQGFTPDTGPDLPTPALLREAFLWGAHRKVTKTATVSLHGVTYTVDACLVGRDIELLFDPFDLTRIEVRWRGTPMGLAVVHHLGQHVRRPAPPDTQPPPADTGIDYLRLLETAHHHDQAQPIDFAALTDPSTSTKDTP